MRFTRMLRARQQLQYSTAESRLEQFHQCFKHIWQDRGPRRKLGLAISGGIDSTALASLCVRLNREKNLELDIHAFVVDHHLRAGSTVEAHTVAHDVRNKLGIAASVLSATGLASHKPVEHIEATARQARYRLLGQACVNEGISLLFTGHHADDQAATLLLRLVNGYLGEGLGGMSINASLPECDGMYGVHDSGSSSVPRKLDSSSHTFDDHLQALSIEHGGVKLGRPLLTFSKSDLKAECQDQDLQWYEDVTNKDQSYTTRNTLNTLLDQEVLPIALRKPRLLQMADVRQQRKDLARRQAAKMMEDCDLKLDSRTGRLNIRLAERMLGTLRQHPAFEEAVAHTMRSVVSIITPKSELSTQAVSQITRDICAADFSAGKTWNVRSVRVSCTSSDDGVHQLRLARANPLPSETLSALEINMPAEISHWTDWQLWDGRYWFRVKQIGPTDDRAVVQLHLRFMRHDDTSKMSQKLALAVQRVTLSLETRRTLPVLTEYRNSEQGRTDKILALPSLGLSDTGAASVGDCEHRDHIHSIWLYEMRYKAVGSLAEQKIGLG